MLRIAVVGAGLAGLASAVAAATAGCEVDVFDAQAQIAAPAAHLDVVPTMLRDLVALGVADACVRRGFAYRGIAVVDSDGRPGFEIPTPALAGVRWPAAIGMAYADLLRVLHDAAVDAGALVHFGSPVVRVEAAPAAPALWTSNGRTWQGHLLLIAGARAVDGVALPLASEFAALPQRWDHTLVARPRGLDRSTWVIGPDRAKALLVPVSSAQAGLAVLRDAAADHSLESLRACLVAQRGVLGVAGASLRSDARVIGRPVHSGLLRGPWHSGAALRIGSSAHLLPPHFGQAAAQSVEDAAVLGDLLRTEASRDELFTRFMQRRAARAERVHAVTTQAARWDLRPEPATDLTALARQLAPIVEAAA